MTDVKFFRGTEFWIRIFPSVSASFNKVENVPNMSKSVKITATIRNTILFNKVIMNLLRDCNPKKWEKCLTKRLINSANPSTNFGKFLIKKTHKVSDRKHVT